MLPLLVAIAASVLPAAAGPNRLARAIERMVGQASDQGAPIDIKLGGDDDSDNDEDDASAAISRDDLPGNIKVRVTPEGPKGLVPPMPPMPPGAQGVAARFSLHVKDAAAVDVLHRIAQSAGWSLTVAGVADEKVSLDADEVDPREAVREVLRKSHSWGVLRDGRLVVIPASGAGARIGELIEKRGKNLRRIDGKRQDLVHVFEGDLVIPRGTVVHGDATVIGGTLTVEPGALVQGDAVAVLGGINVENGGLVMGDSVAVLGSVDVEPGAQVLGQQLKVGMGKIVKGAHLPRFSGRSRRAGLFGFFPTLALFAIMYLVGLLALFMAPDRLRNIGATLQGNPVRSFFVGFLAWLCILPLAILLCVTLVGIPLLPLIPLGLFLSEALGFAAIALAIGQVLPAGPNHQKFVPSAALGMGMAVLTLVAFVPFLGFMVLCMVQFAAMGAVVASRVGRPVSIGVATPPAQAA